MVDRLLGLGIEPDSPNSLPLPHLNLEEMTEDQVREAYRMLRVSAEMVPTENVS